MTDIAPQPSEGDGDELFALIVPVTARAGRAQASFRFAPGAYDSPTLELTRRGALRELVRALRKEAPDAYEDAIASSRTYLAARNAAARRDIQLEFELEAVNEWAATLTAAGEHASIRDWDLLRERHAAVAVQSDASGAVKAQHIKRFERDIGGWAATWHLADAEARPFVRLVFANAIRDAPESRELVLSPRQADTSLDQLREWLRRSELDQTALIGEREPPLQLPEANILYQDKQTYLAQAQRRADAYFEQQCAALEAAGARRAPHKRVSDLHFRCYIRWQVCNESLNQIAKAVFREHRGNLSQGIKSVAALTGMPLRGPKPPGRRPAAR